MGEGRGLGEGLLALSVALSFGHFANPWAYMVFVVSIFTWRQREVPTRPAPRSGPSTRHG